MGKLSDRLTKNMENVTQLAGWQESVQPSRTAKVLPRPFRGTLGPAPGGQRAAAPAPLLSSRPVLGARVRVRSLRALRPRLPQALLVPPVSPLPMRSRPFLSAPRSAAPVLIRKLFGAFVAPPAQR